MRILLLAVLLTGLWPDLSNACGKDTDCKLGDRVYRIAMPEGVEGPIGALVYSHGYRGSHKGAMRNKALLALAHDHGMALVSTKSAGVDWLIPGVPQDPKESGEKEFVYFDALLNDLTTRHGIDPDRILATGFSAGGMMVWNLACNRGEDFAAFLPIAGTFWEPVPSDCPSGAVNLVHVHGTADKIVPLTGRPIAETRQGSVFEALEMLGNSGTYGDRTPAPGIGELTCAIRTAEAGKVLGFCTHPGGHSFRTEYLEAAFQILQGAGVLAP